MADFLSTPAAQLVILVAMTAALIAVGVYVILKVRGGGPEELPSASSLLTNFRELHSEGDLSDEEYRTIKAVLSEQLQEELKDNRDKD